MLKLFQHYDFSGRHGVLEFKAGANGGNTFCGRYTLARLMLILVALSLVLSVGSFTNLVSKEWKSRFAYSGFICS